MAYQHDLTITNRLRVAPSKEIGDGSTQTDVIEAAVCIASCTDTDTGEQRRGRAPRGETRRSEKGHARAENAQTASDDRYNGARRFSCPENEKRRRECGP